MLGPGVAGQPQLPSVGCRPMYEHMGFNTAVVVKKAS
jgi:hypothetical protein